MICGAFFLLLFGQFFGNLPFSLGSLSSLQFTVHEPADWPIVSGSISLLSCIRWVGRSEVIPEYTLWGFFFLSAIESAVHSY